MKYTLEKLIAQYNSHQRFKYLFFWGSIVYDNITKTCLSQWYPVEFEVDGIKYYNMEQYMMSEKALLFNDSIIRKQILNSREPKQIKALGRKVKNFDEKVWDEHKCKIIYEGNCAKFSENQDLKEYLLSTQSKILVEASPYDKIWGIGLKQGDMGVENPNNWKGQNLLGFTLMEVRDFLKN